MWSTYLQLSVLLQAGISLAAPHPRAVNPYAPVVGKCPTNQLVRQASGVSSAEASYVAKRYIKATAALESWLASVDPGFVADKGQWGSWEGQVSAAGKPPVIALTSSGGGYRAQLTGAGVIKGFDSREAPLTGVSGVYEALTYHSGLSGGSWLLSSIAGNNFPTISSLQKNLYEPGLQDSLLVPEILVSQAARPIYNQIEADVAAKAAAGFSASLIDPWGRILAESLLYGTDAGVMDTMSGIASLSNFTSHNAPYPVITALGSDLNISGVCIPQVNATQYEFHPYEFGSWDAGVAGFVNITYLGTTFNNGKPVDSNMCVTNYDQLSYVLGTSSDVFASACSAVPANMTAESDSLGVVENLAYLTNPAAPYEPEIALFGLYPNPFQGLASSPHVASQKTLDLVDGGVGVGFQGDPIWPFLHRDVDVIIVSANSADTATNYPNGSEILHTYQAAVAAGLTRMPFIPSDTVFASAGLNTKPTFFGCNTNSTATIVYIPNTNYTYNSGQPTAKIQYNVNETDAMIANGVQIANYGGKADWPLCLACGITKKSGGPQPAGCAACYKEYCYN